VARTICERYSPGSSFEFRNTVVRNWQLPVRRFNSSSQNTMQRSFSRARMAYRWIRLCLLLFSLVGGGTLATGEDEPAAAESAAPDAGAEFRFSVAWVSTGGSYTYVPEKWGELRINLVNARDVSRELLCTTYFDDEPTLQFGRRVWLPARSMLRISHPVLIPKCDVKQGRAVNLHSLVLEGSATDDVLVKNDLGKLLHDGALLVTHSSRNTAIIAESSANIDIPPKDVTEMLEAGRVGQQLTKRVALLLDPFLPPDETSLNAFDQIVIAENRIANDMAAMSALRQWLGSGGHLWIMLDRVDPVVVEKLFGDQFTGHLVDRVGLTSVRVDKSPTLSDIDGALGEQIDYEEPVEMARVVVSNMDVSHVVNGWPAAMSMPYGDGKVIITTLGPRGWIKSSPPNSQSSDDPLVRSSHVPTGPMHDLASDFFSQREPELLSRQDLEPQVREYVGYSIPSWGLVVGTLIGFSVSLVAVGLWLMRSGQLEHLGWIGSAMAVAVSIGLLMVGWSYRHGVPATIATVQIVNTIPGTDDVRSEGLVAVYHADGTQASIRATRGGQMLPDMTGLEGSARRMVTTDFGAWHWENLPQPSGLRASPFRQGETVANRIEARATLNANGVVGKFSGRLAPGTDAMLATRDGRIGVTLQDDGVFTARAEDLFDKEQYLGAGLLSDEQDRRRRTLQHLFTSTTRRDYPNRPQLMFWSDHWENGFQFGEGLKAQGAALVTVPLIFDRPPNGTEITIPSPLITYRNRTGPDGSPPSTMWNYGRKEWQERSTPGSAWLNFQVPREFLPIKPGKARISMKVSGPVGRLEFLGWKHNAVTSLATIIDPVGTLSVDVTDADVLTLSETGGLALGVRAGDPSRPELTGTTDRPPPLNSAADGSGSRVGKGFSDVKVNYWRIESLTLQLWATTTEPTVKD
jgi:hypothetical protein